MFLYGTGATKLRYSRIRETLSKSVFSLLICKTKFITKGFSVKKILTIFLLLLLAAGGIGVMRQGRELVFSKVIFNLLQEPIYTSYSVVTYLQNNRIEKLLEFPDITLSGFVNLIPYKLFPGKINYMASVYTKGNGIQAPLGATHFFVSYILDYGIIGSIILFFMIGKCIAFLSEGTQNYLKKTVYCLVSANLMFTFFRDAIAIAIIKNVLEFSVLVPVGIYGINYLLETTVRKS